MLTDGDVTLRAHRAEDADAIVEQCTDPSSIRWTTVPLGYDRAMAVDWVTNSVATGWKSGAERLFAIESTHPDGRRRFSGSLSLRDEGAHRAEIAFGAHPAVRGRGVMTAAVNLLLTYGFEELDVETVLWLANVGNVGSRRIAWKTGFTFGGLLPHWLNQRGEYLDAWVGTLHKSDERSPKSQWPKTPVIEGDNVRLRPLAAKDVPRIAKACADQRTQYWLSLLPSPYTEQDAHTFVARAEYAAIEGIVTWAVADRGTDEILANVGLPRQGNNSREIGFWTHPDARGRGVMREAVSLVIRHCFGDPADGGLGIHRLYLRAASDNVASQHVATANGFTMAGRERQSELLGDGTYADMLLFDLLASESRTAYRLAVT